MMLLGSHEYILACNQAVAMQIVIRHSLDEMFAISWDIWSAKVLPAVMDLKARHMGISGNDVAAFMKDLQIDPSAFPGKKFDLVFEMPEPDVGVMTFNKCAAPTMWEALGREDILEKGCHMTCPASIEETAKLYNPNMKMDVLAIPPRIDADHGVAAGSSACDRPMTRSTCPCRDCLTNTTYSETVERCSTLLAWLVRVAEGGILTERRSFVAGRWVEGALFPVENPADESMVDRLAATPLPRCSGPSARPDGASTREIGRTPGPRAGDGAHRLVDHLESLHGRWSRRWSPKLASRSSSPRWPSTPRASCWPATPSTCTSHAQKRPTPSRPTNSCGEGGAESAPLRAGGCRSGHHPLQRRHHHGLPKVDRGFDGRKLGHPAPEPADAHLVAGLRAGG